MFLPRAQALDSFEMEVGDALHETGVLEKQINQACLTDRTGTLKADIVQGAYNRTRDLLGQYHQKVLQIQTEMNSIKGQYNKKLESLAKISEDQSKQDLGRQMDILVQLQRKKQTPENIYAIENHRIKNVWTAKQRWDQAKLKVSQIQNGLYQYNSEDWQNIKAQREQLAMRLSKIQPLSEKLGSISSKAEGCVAIATNSSTLYKEESAQAAPATYIANSGGAGVPTSSGGAGSAK